MKLKIVPNYYAPKLEGILDEYEKIHCIVWPKCNFKCRFCDFWQRSDIVFKDINIDNFEKVVQYLIKESQAFKFTGGEPCLNPKLKEMLGIVKKYNGKIFLDTNGSYSDIIRDLIDANLIDVLAISLKGSDENEAKINSGLVNSKLCWEQVLKTIQYSSRKNVKTIITRVLINKIDKDELSKFAELLNIAGDNLYLKINNLMRNDYNKELKPIEEDIIQKEIRNLMKNHPEYIGRIIYIKDKSSVYTRENIQHY